MSLWTFLGFARRQITRRRFLEAGAATIGFIAGCRSPTEDRQTEDRQEVPVEVTVEPIVTNLTVPWDLAFAPSGDLYFTERPGRISMLPADVPQPTTLATLPETPETGEGGLLGLALHPEFPDTPLLFVYQTYQSEGLRNRILRFRRTEDGLDRQGIVLDGIPGEVVHDGGRLAFGPDDKLYATTGDAHQADRSQDPYALSGKILRLNPDGSIPGDNPFDDSFTWSYGHRNPEGLAWHPETDQLYSTEHGAAVNDEVNRIQRGNNYGWPEARGEEGPERFTPPLLHSGSETWAPAGATFYTGDVFPTWRGGLFFTTLGTSPGDGRRSLHHVQLEAAGRAVETHRSLLNGQLGRLRAVVQGPDGYLYVATSNRDGRGDPASEDDQIVRLRPERS